MTRHMHANSGGHATNPAQPEPDDRKASGQLAAAVDPGRLPEGQSEGRLVLTIPEAYRALAIGESTLRQLIASGQLPVLRIGRRVLVPRQAVEALVAAAITGRQETAPSPDGSDR